MDTAAFRELKAAFEDGLYGWAQTEFEREISGDFTILRSLCNPEADFFLACIDSWPGSRRRQLAAALLRRAHNAAATRAGQGPSPQNERILLELQTERDRRIQQQAATAGARPLVSGVRREIIRTLRPELERALGPQAEGSTKTEWRYATLRPGWRVSTVVDLGGRMSVVKYWHRVAALADGHGMSVGMGLSWPGCLGLPTLATWFAVAPECAPQVAAAVLLLCQRFVAAMPLVLGSDRHAGSANS